MRRDFKFAKRTILLAVGALLIGDVALALYGWKLGSGPRPGQELAVLAKNRDLLRADIKRAQEIRQKMPSIQKDCDQFEDSLFPQSTGYSSVNAELGSIAGKAGLQVESQNFKEVEVKNRPLIQVDIDTVVAGSYTGIVNFLNGLQRSGSMYAVESLAAKGENESQGNRGLVRVSLHIKTYFRTAG